MSSILYTLKKKLKYFFNNYWMVYLLQQQHIMSSIYHTTNKMSNIYSSEITNIRGGVGCISKDMADRLYTQLMEQWNNDYHSIWTFCRQRNQLVGMTLDEWVASVGSSFQFQISTGYVKCEEYNNKQHNTIVDKRTWYQLVVQPCRQTDMDVLGFDPITLITTGFMVGGFVYHFSSEKERDVMYNKINHKCMSCRLRTPPRGKQLCVKCAKTPVNPAIRDMIMASDPELFKDPTARAGMEAAIAMTSRQIVDIIAEPPRLPTEIETMLDKIKREDEERMAKEWGEWLIKNEPEPIKVVVKAKNPPKDGAKKNIPAKPPAFIRSPAGCQISNHLAVKKWMDKYGNK